MIVTNMKQNEIEPRRGDIEWQVNIHKYLQVVFAVKSRKELSYIIRRFYFEFRFKR